MRRLAVIGVVGLLAAVVVPGAALAPAGASAPAASYGTPFREDGATFTKGTFSGGVYPRSNVKTDANGCIPPSPSNKAVTGAPSGNPDAYDCLPAGATAVQLADGRILYWDALEGTENLAFGSTNSAVPDGGRITVNDESRLLNFTDNGPSWAKPSPVDGGAHNPYTGEKLPLPAPLAATQPTYNDASLFCSDQVFLSNGSVLTVGGTDYYSEPTIPGTNKGVIELEGIRNTRIFVPADAAPAGTNGDTWVQAAPMNHGRWYPALVTLGNGDVFVASGVTKLIKPFYPGHVTDSGTNVEQTETYDPSKNTWTDNGTGATRSLPLFPRLHLLPDGHVYYDAAGQDFNPAGQSYDEALWNMAGSYDPATKTWTDLGVPGVGDPTVGLANIGFRGSTFSAALQLRPDSKGRYSAASFLTAGGVLLPSPGSYVAVKDSRIDTVTMTGGSEKLSTVGTGALPEGRWYSTGVPLPDGTVYAVDGADVDEVVSPGLESPLLQAELFTPTPAADGSYSGGAWTSAGTVARKRTYHNTAILRPDGSVLIGGNAPIPALYNQVQDGPDLPGRPGTNNHHDSSFQVFYPWYMKAARPSVGDISWSPGHITIETPDAAHIADVVLTRNAALTHLVDGDARSVVLPVVNRTDDSVTVQLPASASVVPAGPYLLFAIEGANGNPADTTPGKVIPSVGRQVFIGSAGAAGLQVLVHDAAASGATVAAPVNPSASPAVGAKPSVRMGASPASASVPAPAPARRRGRWSWLLVAAAMAFVVLGAAAVRHQVTRSPLTE